MQGELTHTQYYYYVERWIIIAYIRAILYEWCYCTSRPEGGNQQIAEAQALAVFRFYAAVLDDATYYQLREKQSEKNSEMIPYYSTKDE